jgi:hypothetical protein
MNSDLPTSLQSSATARPFQFSLATVFLLFVLVSLAGGICFALPEGIAAGLVIFLVPAIPAMLLTSAIVSSGYGRTFSIGAMFPTVMVLPILIVFIVAPLLGATEKFVLPGDPNATEQTLENWRAIAGAMGIAVRPPAVASWAAALLTGLFCVAIRWAVRRSVR